MAVVSHAAPAPPAEAPAHPAPPAPRRPASPARPPVGRPTLGTRLRRAFPGAGRIWPLASICLGIPVWFVLGAAAVAWSLPALVLGGDLIRRRRVRIPPGGGPALALLGWIVLSGVQIRSPQAMVMFGYRASLFASGAVLFVWLWNTPSRVVPTRTLVELLAAFWLVLVAFGYLALLFPMVDAPSPLQQLLPGALRADDYVRDLTGIAFAEVQGILGNTVARPSAPMVYANGYGSTLGILTPFFFLAWIVQATPRRRRVGIALLLVAVVPAVASLNRGLWLSVGVALSYVALRTLVRGDARTARNVVLAGVVLVGIVVLTPLRGMVEVKFAGREDGDATRSTVYEEALEYSARSPLLGHGGPVAREDVAVAVGTHGLIWFLLVSHGIPAAALFLTWLGGIVWKGVQLRGPTGTWAAASAVVCAFQVPIYGLLPQIALLGVIGAIILRERTGS